MHSLETIIVRNNDAQANYDAKLAELKAQARREVEAEQALKGRFPVLRRLRKAS